MKGFAKHEKSRPQGAGFSHESKVLALVTRVRLGLVGRGFRVLFDLFSGVLRLFLCLGGSFLRVIGSLFGG